MTHCRLGCEKWRSDLIAGSATLTIAMSSTTMNWAVTMTASASQRRLSGAVRNIVFTMMYFSDRLVTP